MRWPQRLRSFFSFGPRVVHAAEPETGPGASAGSQASASAESGGAEPSPPVPGTVPSDPSSRAPIQYEHFAREWGGLSSQDNFDGFRLEAGKQVAKNLQASHTLFLGTTAGGAGYIYQFGPTFQSEDARTVLVGRIGLDRGVTGRLIQKLGDSMELKANIHSSLKTPQQNMYEVATDYCGSDWCAAAKLAWQSTWILNGGFAQVVTPNLHLGAETTWIAMNGGASIGAVGMRWAKGKDVFTGTLCRQPDFKTGAMNQQGQVKMQYVRRVTDRLSLGSEFEYSHPDMESSMRMAYEYTFRQARVQGLVDTAGRVSAMVSDFMGFGLSGQIDYARGDYKFGFMMHVVPQPEGGAGGPPPL